jgi:hypothetical protein
VSQFFVAQGECETKIDLIGSHNDDSTFQAAHAQAATKLIQNVNNQDDFLDIIQKRVTSTIEQLKSKGSLIIDYRLLIQQSVFRYHAYIKNLQEFAPLMASSLVISRNSKQKRRGRQVQQKSPRWSGKTSKKEKKLKTTPTT